MTKRELLDLLEGFEDDDEIMLSYPSGLQRVEILCQDIMKVTYEKVVWDGYHFAYKPVGFLESQDKPVILLKG